jgi:hypothetical protein
MHRYSRLLVNSHAIIANQTNLFRRNALTRSFVSSSSSFSEKIEGTSTTTISTVIFPWREKPKSEFGSAFMERIAQFFFFRKYPDLTEKDFLEGAKAAFQATVLAVFQHPELAQYDNDLKAKVKLDGDLIPVNHSLNMGDIFTPRLENFLQRKIRKFIEDQRDLLTKNQLPHQLVYQLLQIDNLHIQKFLPKHFSDIHERALDDIRRETNMNVITPPELQNGEPVHLLTIHMFVDVKCKGIVFLLVRSGGFSHCFLELFYAKDLASGKIVQGSDKAVDTSHQVE